MDISCPPYLDFLHGGLNFQVEHHVRFHIPSTFPTLLLICLALVDQSFSLERPGSDSERLL